MIFFEANEMFRVLCEEYDAREMNGSVSVDIATYGISLFDEKFSGGYIEESRAKQFMNKLTGKGRDVRILIGLPPIKKFSKAEYGLREMEYRQKIAEVLRLGEEYGVCCLPTVQSHLKMYRINDLYVVGGINFGNSYWTDCSVAIENPDDKEQLQYVFDGSWHGAATVQPLYTTIPHWLSEQEFEEAQYE